MQNQPNPQMAAMAAMNNANMPVDGTPVMGNLVRPGANTGQDPRNLINTYIYDYFLRNKHFQLAKQMIEEPNLKINFSSEKDSPGGRHVNGADAMDGEEKHDLPSPALPTGQCVENSFLMDWWLQFWDIFSAARGRGANGKSTQYSVHARNLQQMQNEQRNSRLQMMQQGNMNPAQFNMMRMGPNGMVPNNDLKRAAMNNRNPNGPNAMNNMTQMKNQMISAQMQRDGSGMDMNGQRPQSPATMVEGAPSPNKRPRVEGGMNGNAMAGNQFNEFAPQGQNGPQKALEGMNPGVQGAPMNQGGLEGSQDMFAGNGPRGPGLPAAPGQPQGNHALQDYQMQLMLLEQQNKKRLLMARQEQDSITTNPHQPGSAFPPAMSPQGSRAGPSPNPTDQMKRGTPKMGQGPPGSPMPDNPMQPQRNSPAPSMGMGFDPTMGLPGQPPQMYPQMQQTPMMRPPSSHPNGFNGNPNMTPQQLEAMRQNGMANGAWRPGQPQMGMMPGQGQQMGGPMGNPQQRNQMPPPPAPPGGEQPRTQEPSPSQPAQAPPTPSSQNKANPKKKAANDKKKAATTKAKGGNAGAASAAGGDDTAPTPTPSTPITPVHKASFANGQQAGQPPSQPQAAAAPPQPQQPMDNNQPFGAITDDPDLLSFDAFGTTDALENFDFDSFLHVGGDDNGFNLGDGFNFGDTVEAGGEI